MPLVKAICTNCGAQLEVNDALDAAICPHCNTAYIVEKAINNYNTTNNTFNNIHADNLNIEFEKEFVIKAGELVEYNGASVDVIVPEGVYKIGSAFREMKYLRSVTLPKSLREIGDYAFAGCANLERVVSTHSEHIEFRANAFSGCSKLHEIVGLGISKPLSVYVCAICGAEVQTETSLSQHFICPVCNVPSKYFTLKTR